MLIVFDLDGTLIDTERVAQLRLTDAARILEHDARMPCADIAARLVALRKTEGGRAAIETFGEEHGLARALVQQAASCYDAEHAEPIPLIPGVRETILALAAEHTLAIVTYGTKRAQRSKLEGAGLLELSHDGRSIFADRIEIVEPIEGKAPRKREAYERILKTTGTPPKDALAVGDKLGLDVVEALLCGMRAIWVDASSERKGPVRAEEDDRAARAAPPGSGVLVISSVAQLPSALSMLES